MKFFRTTLAGGILFLVPLVVFALIIEKALALVHKLVAPLAARLPAESIIGMRPAMLLAIVVLVILCFLAGVFARTRFARRIVEWLETTVLSNIPGYQFFKSLGESAFGVESKESHQAVLAHLDDAWQLGFLVERLDNGLLAVFVPDAPNPHAGAVFFMTPENVTVIGDAVPPIAVQKCLKRLGGGANDLLGKIHLSGKNLSGKS